MSDIRSFKKQWIEFVVEKRLGIGGIQTVAQFENEFRGVIDTLLDSISEDIATDGFAKLNAAEVKQNILNRNEVTFGERGSVHRCLRHYRACYLWLDEVITKRVQEDWATTWDHIKNFIYKTLTAITFAAIILGTAFIANQLGIMIPSIRFGI